jgi:small subunit ribosomal protein S3Ae
MTQGKSKRVPKGKNKKKKVDPFQKKDWFDVKAPQPFTHRFICKTPVNKSSGKKLSSDSLKGRVFETSVGDLMNDEEYGHQIVKLRVDEVADKDCLTTFYGMRFTTDKVRSLVKKWHSLIETQLDVTTLDGYTLRMFAVGFTKRRQLQIKKTTYASHSQIMKMSIRMKDIMSKKATSMNITELVTNLINNLIGIEIARECSRIFPLINTYVHRVKVLKAPKIDPTKLLELHKERDIGEETKKEEKTEKTESN